jgi:hypothetical protein
MFLCEERYRQAMVGTISLYDQPGERLHTISVGATPEYGQAAFMERMEREIAHVKPLYPPGDLCRDRRWCVEQLGFLGTVYAGSDPRFLLTLAILSGRGKLIEEDFPVGAVKYYLIRVRARVVQIFSRPNGASDEG